MYAKGDKIYVLVEYSEKVAFPDGFSPEVRVDFDGETRVAVRECYRDNYFDYWVQDGDFDADGIVIPNNALSFPEGGYIKDLAGNDAILTHAGFPADREYKVDARGPRLVSAATSTDGRTVALTFDENISVAFRLRALSQRTGVPASQYIIAVMNVHVDNEDVGVTDASVSEKTLSLTLEKAVTQGQTVTVSYHNIFAADRDTEGILQDYYNNYLHDFLAQEVVNHSTASTANPKPTNLRATSADGEITLTWTPGNDDSYTGQEVKRRTTKKGAKWTTVATIGVSDTEYVDDSVTVGTKYIPDVGIGPTLRIENK